MIPARQMPLALATAGRRGTAVVLTHRCQRQQQPHSTAAAPPSWRSADKPPAAVGHDPDRELLQLEDEYSTLKVNWFPGHMVKATKVIRDKLKQVRHGCHVVSVHFHGTLLSPGRSVLYWDAHAYPQQ